MEKKPIDLDKLTPKQLEVEDLLSQVTLLVDSENYDAAMETLEKLQKINPQEIDIYLRIAQIHIIRDEFAAAYEALDKAAYINKTDARVYYYRGNAMFLEGRMEESLAEYGLAEEYGLKTDSMYMNMGFAYEQTGKPNQALQAYGKAVRLDPENPMYRYRRISLLLANNDVDTAEEQITDFLKRFPNIRDGYFLAVDVLFRKGKFAEAETMLLDVLEEHGEDTDIQALLIRAYTLLGKHREAIALGNKVLANPEATSQAIDDVTQTLPRLYLLEGEVDKGLEFLNATIKAEKEGEYNLNARTLLVTLLASLKRYRELLPQVESILAVPELREKLYMTYYLKGKALQELGRTDEARTAYRDAVNKLRMISIRRPASVDARIYRALSHQGLAEYEEALEELSIVEKLKAQTAEFYALRASIYEDMGDKERAEADKKKAESLQNKKK